MAAWRSIDEVNLNAFDECLGGNGSHLDHGDEVIGVKICEESEFVFKINKLACSDLLILIFNWLHFRFIIVS